MKINYNHNGLITSDKFKDLAKEIYLLSKFKEIKITKDNWGISIDIFYTNKRETYYKSIIDGRYKTYKFIPFETNKLNYKIVKIINDYLYSNNFYLKLISEDNLKEIREKVKMHGEYNISINSYDRISGRIETLSLVSEDKHIASMVYDVSRHKLITMLKDKNLEFKESKVLGCFLNDIKLDEIELIGVM